MIESLRTLNDCVPENALDSNIYIVDLAGYHYPIGKIAIEEDDGRRVVTIHMRTIEPEVD